jgi:hypothetical protein
MVAHEVAIGRCLNILCRFVIFVGGRKCPAAELHCALSEQRGVWDVSFSSFNAYDRRSNQASLHGKPV